MIIVSDYH